MSELTIHALIALTLALLPLVVLLAPGIVRCMDGVIGVLVIVNVVGVLLTEPVQSRLNPLLAVLHALALRMLNLAGLSHAVKIAD
jgi:hypothetical protein